MQGLRSLYAHSIWHRLLGILAVAACSVSMTGMAAESGKLSFKQFRHDFGTVYRGEQLRYRFAFSNTGKGPLVIQAVHAACGCTAIEVEKGRVYQPGDTGFVEVHLDTADFQGQVSKKITVVSNEKLQPDRTLMVRAEIQSEIAATPPLVDFGHVAWNETPIEKVRLTAMDDARQQDWRITGLDYDKSKLDVSYRQDATSWVVRIQLKKGQKTGFFRDSVFIRSNSKYLSEMEIPVRADVRPVIHHKPAYLEFGTVHHDRKIKRDVILQAIQPFEMAGSAVELIVNGKKVSNDKGTVKVSPIQRKKNGERYVTIALQNIAKLQGSAHGKVVLTTNSKHQKNVSVDFYALFR